MLITSINDCLVEEVCDNSSHDAEPWNPESHIRNVESQNSHNQDADKISSTVPIRVSAPSRSKAEPAEVITVKYKHQKTNGKSKRKLGKRDKKMSSNALAGEIPNATKKNGFRFFGGRSKNKVKEVSGKQKRATARHTEALDATRRNVGVERQVVSSSDIVQVEKARVMLLDTHLIEDGESKGGLYTRERTFDWEEEARLANCNSLSDADLGIVTKITAIESEGSSSLSDSASLSEEEETDTYENDESSDTLGSLPEQSGNHDMSESKGSDLEQRDNVEVTESKRIVSDWRDHDDISEFKGIELEQWGKNEILVSGSSVCEVKKKVENAHPRLINSKPKRFWKQRKSKPSNDFLKPEVTHVAKPSTKKPAGRKISQPAQLHNQTAAAAAVHSEKRDDDGRMLSRPQEVSKYETRDELSDDDILTNPESAPEMVDMEQPSSGAFCISCGDIFDFSQLFACGKMDDTERELEETSDDQLKRAYPIEQLRFEI